jgi:TetR/AcrR family transcriptional regulator
VTFPSNPSAPWANDNPDLTVNAMNSGSQAQEPEPTGPTGRRSYRAPGREEQKRRTRQRILQCALKHFSERGFEAASLRDIAAEAQLSFAAIQKHFGSKEELWRAAIDDMFARQDEELGSAQWLETDRLTIEDIREFVHRYVRYCARHPEHVRITVHESLGDSKRVKWMTDCHLKRVHEPFVRLFTRAADDGLVARVPTPSMTYILTSAAGMMFALGAEVMHVYDVDVHDPTVVEAHAEAICTILLGNA